MYIRRDITDTLIRFSKFPVVVVLGPRQSGKTTVVKETFSKRTYVSLEDPAILSYATSDPRGFLQRYRSSHGIIMLINFYQENYIPPTFNRILNVMFEIL